MNRTPPPALPHRLAVRRLVRACGKAALATLAAEGGGPYASLVTVATDQEGHPLLLLSGLADHTRNIAADPRVSLLFDGTEGLANPQQGPRVTLIGRILRCDDLRRRERFLARHPAARLYAGFADFAFHRMIVERAHYVGGFARAVWLNDGLTADAPVAAEMAVAEGRLMTHINERHGDGLDRLAARQLKSRGRGWRVVAVDVDGFDLGRGEMVARIPFPAPVAGPDEALAALQAIVERV